MDAHMATHFGERLREIRERVGVTQEALARAAGLSTSAVSKIEQKGVDPAWSTVRRLAKALGVSCQAFEDEDPPAEPAEEKPRGMKRRGGSGSDPDAAK